MRAGLSRLNCRATWTLGLVLLVIGCGPDATAPSGLGPISLSVVSGNGQSGVVGIELPQPLVIKATDSRGVVQAGLTVNFRVTSGGGSMYAGTAATDNKGIAEDYWTLGTSTAQTQRVEVRAVLSSGLKQVYGVFTASALPGLAAQIAILAGNQQTAHPASTVPIAPAVRVTDQYGNPVPNVAVTFTPAAGSGTVPSGTPMTDANGTATVGSWTLGSTCGSSNTLGATATGLAGNPVTFTARVGDCWTAGAPMPTPRWEFGVGVVNGILYAVGGRNTTGATFATVEAYDPSKDTWTTKASMSAARTGLAVGVVNGILYAVGGQDINGDKFTTVEAYDPATDTWRTKASMPTARADLGVAVINGILYAVGGRSGNNGYLATVEVYDPATDTWGTRTSMLTPRSGLAVGVVNGILYGVGGINDALFGSPGELSIVEAYDASVDTWTTKASMPAPRDELGVGVFDGIVYAVGGYDGSYLLNTVAVVAYDPSKDTWSTKASIATARWELGLGVVNGILYAMGGQDVNGTTLATLEAYHP